MLKTLPGPGLIALLVTACQPQQPAKHAQPVAEAPAQPAPVSPEARRRERQVQSAENQIEAQMQAELDSRAAAADKTDH